ncbi:MAG TPA: crossover junction endodeoxyribonuclease RuvC [Methylovirgula sp.]
MQPPAIRILGIDPGLRNMGWGVIELAGSHLLYIASGTIRSNDRAALASRLCALHENLREIVAAYGPHEAAIEEVFVNRDAQSTLKLGQARGIALVVPALAGLPVVEYAANKIKKTVVGVGHAEKTQVILMVRALLPKWQSEGAAKASADAADALAVAITHARYRIAPRVTGAAHEIVSLLR